MAQLEKTIIDLMAQTVANDTILKLEAEMIATTNLMDDPC